MANWKRSGQKPKGGGAAKGTSGSSSKTNRPSSKQNQRVHDTNRRGSRRG
ncbi:MAG: hypothetical protein QOH12_2958 [Solirubrobacteraceae bacterium]|jgi:hypothetical protein|nr:hypothetical protein [Solirubrobacteraceae bacterium]